VPGCGRRHYAHGLCKGHGKRLARFGKVLAHVPLSFRTTAESFWENVDTSGGLDECWPYAGAAPGCYGQVTWNMAPIGAHRMAWMLTHGPIPDGLFVCHQCDNPPCCNAERCLFLGTSADNSADMAVKGRSSKGDRHGFRRHPEMQPRGERHGMAILTNAQVLEIRARLSEGESRKGLAVTFQVCVGTIDGIATRRSWAHLTGP
jgi:hypothetical protein